MTSNPDLFPKGTAVVLSALGKQEQIARADAQGRVTSPYPIDRIVTVKWNYNKTGTRLHVDFLSVMPSKRED